MLCTDCTLQALAHDQLRALRSLTAAAPTTLFGLAVHALDGDPACVREVVLSGGTSAPSGPFGGALASFSVPQSGAIEVELSYEWDAHDCAG